MPTQAVKSQQKKKNYQFNPNPARPVISAKELITPNRNSLLNILATPSDFADNGTCFRLFGSLRGGHNR